MRFILGVWRVEWCTEGWQGAQRCGRVHGEVAEGWQCVWRDVQRAGRVWRGSRVWGGMAWCAEGVWRVVQRVMEGWKGVQRGAQRSVWMAGRVQRSAQRGGRVHGGVCRKVHRSGRVAYSQNFESLSLFVLGYHWLPLAIIYLASDNRECEVWGIF